MSSGLRALKAGIDMGGTGTRLILLDGLREVAAVTLPTARFAALPQAQRINALISRLRGLCPRDAAIVSLGIGASGPVNNRTGIIENAETLPCFSGFPLRDQLQTQLGVPTVIDNDAVAAALGEYHAGAGRESARMLMVTLGTGIGVALLEQGQPWRAADGRHPESGHIPVTNDPRACYCGITGCWEMAASRSWLQQALQGLLPYLSWPEATPESLIMASRRDPRIASLMHHYGERVGRGLGTLMTLYGPDVIVLSGSAARLLPLFRDGLNVALQRAGGYALQGSIVQSILGDAAGALGAALMPDHKDYA